MASLALHSTHVNRGYEAFDYRLDPHAHRALLDLLSLYHPTAGPVRRVVTYFGAGGSFHINVGHSEYFDLDRTYQRLVGMPSLETGTSESLFGGGKGYSIHDMFVSSLGEAVERVVGSLALFLGRADQRYGSYADLTSNGLRCLAPEEVPLFSEEQYDDPDFMYERFTERSFMGWLEGRRLLSGEPVWVPAQLVEMLHVFRPDETMIGYSVSGGLSCHISERDALLHGITELIERDAVNLRWYCGIPPKELVVEALPADPRLRTLLADMDALPGEPRFLYHSLDMPEVPVITAIEFDPWLKRFSYNAGGGVDTDGEQALFKAIAEFCQSERTMRMSFLAPNRDVSEVVAQMFDIDPDAPASKMNLFFQAIGYYGHRVNRSKFDWYLGGGERIALSELPVTSGQGIEERWANLLAALERHHLDPIVFDFTPPSVAQMRLMKVFLPELTQAFLQSKPMFGHPRFREVPMALGMEDPGPPRLESDPLPYP